MRIYWQILAIFLVIWSVSNSSPAQMLACSLRASTITRQLILPEDPCSLIPIGKTKIISKGNRTGPPSSTGLAMNYAVTGVKGGHLIEFNPNFTGIKNKAHEKVALDRVNRCFSDFNKTSGNIKLGLNSDPKIPAVQMNVTNAKLREDKNNISTQSLCKVIIHEFLHHAGLVDEYPETQNIPKGQKSCRLPTPARDSIMAEGTLKGVTPRLYPAHRRSLAYPGCKRINPVYSGCARHAGYVVAENSPCPSVWRKCLEGTWLK